MTVLRLYQTTAVEAALRALGTRRRALLVMATGGGKTVCFAYIAEHWRPRGRVLVIAHREELLDQAADKIAHATSLSTGIEQADRRVRQPLPDVVVASVQTLASAQRRATFDPRAFDLIIIDEAHHATASSYREVMGYFSSAAVLGVTATPDRHDGATLTPIFGAPVYRYPIRRAVRDGFLVDIRRVVEVLADLDLAKLSPKGGDWSDGELEAVLIKAPAVAATAAAVVRHAGERITILFCAGIAHSKALAAAINAIRPGSAGWASGDDRAGLADFMAGRVQFLAQTDLCTEGFDYPPLACVALVRPTKSLGRATQQIGRVTRLSEGKPNGLVLEFIGQRNSGQISTVDVVGSDLPPRVRALAEQALDRAPSLSVLDALERAAAGAGSTAVTAARRPAAVIDPMKLVLSLDGMVMVEPTPGAPPANAVQIGKLEAAGLRVAGLDIRQAQMLINGINWRFARRRSTPAQALELARLGHTLECSAVEAARILSRYRAAA